MGEQGNPAFNQVLLKRFVNLMGLFPIGTLVRLNTDAIAWSRWNIRPIRSARKSRL